MQRNVNDGLGFGIFEKVDKDLGLGRGTAWDASDYEDYADFVAFNDVWLQFILKHTHVGIGTYHYAGSETNHALWVILNQLNSVGQLVEGRKKK